MNTHNVHFHDKIIKKSLNTVFVFLSYQKNFQVTQTSQKHFDPLKPHFYIVKLGSTGVYIIFLISAQKHRLWVLVSNKYPQPMF